MDTGAAVGVRGLPEHGGEVAFLFLGEPHHVAHTAPIACALAARSGPLRPIFLIARPEQAAMLREIEGACGARDAAPILELERGLLIRGLDLLARRRRPRKSLLLWRHRALLGSFAAVVVPERTSTRLAAGRGRRPPLIHVPHGAGDGRQGFEPRIARFDLVITAGPKDAARMLREGLVRPGRVAISGYVKRDLVRRWKPAPVDPFRNGRPTVLYNPHFDPGLSSWPRHGRAVVAWFSAQRRYNLILAPHFRLFDGARRSARRAVEGLAVPGRIEVDLGSERCFDMTYTRLADIYLGDASSQAYEFAVEPRPMIFLNSHGVSWEGDEDFRHWRMGEVIAGPDELPAALGRAERGFERFRKQQEEAVAEALGPDDGGAAARAAAAIERFVLHGEAP